MAAITRPELTRAEFWGVVAVALDAWIQWADRRPFRGECPCCGMDVVVVSLGPDDVVLEVAEVLPLMPCSRCAGNVAQGKLGTDPRSKPCWRCGGSRVVGDPVPEGGVLLARDGSASAFSG